MLEYQILMLDLLSFQYRRGSYGRQVKHLQSKCLASLLWQDKIKRNR